LIGQPPKFQKKASQHLTIIKEFDLYIEELEDACRYAKCGSVGL
jgi:hypothetical protein